MLNKTTDYEVDGYAISVVITGERVACSAFKNHILYSAAWDTATVMQCTLSAGSVPTEKPLPVGLMLAFGKARALATHNP
jgi:hypothetical protein